MESTCRSTLMLALIFAALFTLARGYGSGAPVRACAGAQPIHSLNVQPLDPANNPYSFNLTNSEYVPGTNLEVTISEASGGMVNGFFLQGRRIDTGAAVGTFQDPLPTGSQVRDCTNARDSVTHTNPNGKTGLTFTWQAPASGVGQIQFVGAVAIDHDNFYGGMMSTALQEGMAGPTTMSVMNTESDMDMTTDGATMMSPGLGFLLVALIVTMEQLIK